MPATEYPGSFGRSLLSLRRDQVHLMDPTAVPEPTSMEVELDTFQRLVAEKFIDLNASATVDDELLSIQWITKLVDSFLYCQEDFCNIISNHQTDLLKHPMDRLIEDYFERSVKALDVCNAIRDGIEQIRQWKKLIEIVISALDINQTRFLPKEGVDNLRAGTDINDGILHISEAQLQRAKKALIDLAIGMLDEKDSSKALAHRNRSFTRNKDQDSSNGYFRSLSWSVSRSWSAARQLQGIGNNLGVPRANDVIATNGLALTVYTMTSVMLFVMWALVAAIPCQDRGLQVHFHFPRHFQWAAPVMSLHDRIVEESKKREKKNVCGLLREIDKIEKSSRLLSELSELGFGNISEEKRVEMKEKVGDLIQVCNALKDGLDPFEKKIRDVFHRIVRSRTLGLDFRQDS